MSRRTLAVGLVLGLTVLAGCRGAPIREVDAAPVVSAKPLSNEQVEAAIVRAGSGLGWRIAKQSPGKMMGTLTLRSHVAVVDIAYSPKTYSIKYKDSTNLDYNGTSIHKNYNGWIENLDNAIRRELASN